MRRMSRILLLCVLSWLAVASAHGAQAAPSREKRVALVIGNSRYRNIPALPNTANDARLIATTLTNLGFELVGGHALLDLSRPQFEQAIRSFGAQLPGSTVAVFYYAGHGLQIQGTNYLVPVEANPTKAADADFELIDANTILRQMDDGSARLSMVILDACRNNPFGDRGLRDLSRGLAQMAAPRGTLIAYATQPGNVASDGPQGGDGPYALALAKAMTQPQRDVFQVFNTVGNDVYRETNGAQQPWLSSSPIEGDFYFAGTGSAAASANNADQVPPPAPPDHPDERVALPGNGAQPGPPSNRGPFDGTWRLGLSCTPTPAEPNGYSGTIPLTIAGNRISGSAEMKNGLTQHGKMVFSTITVVYEGTVRSDGTVTINGHDANLSGGAEHYEGRIDSGDFRATGTNGFARCSLSSTANSQ